MKTPKPGRILLAATVLLTGCSFTPKHTITAEEAVRRIDAYASDDNEATSFLNAPRPTGQVSRYQWKAIRQKALK